MFLKYWIVSVQVAKENMHCQMKSLILMFDGGDEPVDLYLCFKLFFNLPDQCLLGSLASFNLTSRELPLQTGFSFIRSFCYKKLSVLHDYHYKNVKQEDIPAYSRAMGIGLILIGAGICLTGVINLLTRSALCWIAFVAGFTAGMIIMGKAQKKYNGSWLG